MPDVKLLLATIVVTIASTLGFVSCIATLGGCSADWNRPTPLVKEADNPCWVGYHGCSDNNGKWNGLCCADDHVCRPSGYCAFIGIEGPAWGSSRDAGAEQQTPQVTPEQARKAAPR